MNWLPVIAIGILAVLIRIVLVPRLVRGPARLASRFVPRWAWVVIVPSLVVLSQWIRYHDNPPWVYALGGLSGLAIGVLIAISR